jgi:RNA polymerase sigma-70 factor, ECF subfamily
MDMDRTPEALMTRYQAGDFAAARLLIERISPQLHRFFELQSSNRADADDLLQDAWLRIHRVRHTYQPGRPLLPWVYAIARRVHIDHYRRSIRIVVREQRLEDIAETESIAALETSADRPRADALEELLAPLPQSQREVLEMLKVAGMSLEEVAQATSCSVGSVKQKVHRAYETLRRTMSLVELKKGRSGVLS